MNYNLELELEQKGRELDQEGMNLVRGFLKQNILSLSIKPGSIDYVLTSSDKKLKFVGESQGEEVLGTITVFYKEIYEKRIKTIIKNGVDKLVLYVEGPKGKINLSFDKNLNIIACEASFLNKNSYEKYFLKFDNSKNLVKINYYDGEATKLVIDYLKRNNSLINLSKDLYVNNGLMPDRETDIEVSSQEELIDIVSSFWENAELSEEKYRGFSKKYPSFSKVLTENNK